MASSPPTSGAAAATDQAKQAAETTAAEAKQRAADTAAEAKQKAADTVADAKGKASDLTETAKSEAKDLASQAASAASDKVETAKKTAADVTGDAAPVLDAAAGQLREQGHDAFARYAEQAADGVESFTTAMRDKSVGELLDEAERFARREPGLFVGGAFLLGVLGARFLKADGGTSASGSGAASGSSSMGSRDTTRTGSAALPQRASLRGDALGGEALGGDALATPRPTASSVSGPGSGALPGAPSPK